MSSIAPIRLTRFADEIRSGRGALQKNKRDRGLSRGWHPDIRKTLRDAGLLSACVGIESGYGGKALWGPRAGFGPVAGGAGPFRPSHSDRADWKRWAGRLDGARNGTRGRSAFEVGGTRGCFATTDVHEYGKNPARERFSPSFPSRSRRRHAH